MGQPKAVMLSHQCRGDLSSLGQTSCTQITQKLHHDFARVAEGSAVYVPHCLCSAEDLSLFKALHTELAPWETSPFRRSRHPACIDEVRLLSSNTYRHVVAVLQQVFRMRVAYSIVNLYANGHDWT